MEPLGAAGGHACEQSTSAKCLTACNQITLMARVPNVADPDVLLIAAPTGCGSPLQANGGCGKGGQQVLWPTPLSIAPIGLERRTAASGICDRPNLRTRQGDEIHSSTILAVHRSKARHSPAQHLLLKLHMLACGVVTLIGVRVYSDNNSKNKTQSPTICSKAWLLLKRLHVACSCPEPTPRLSHTTASVLIRNWLLAVPSSHHVSLVSSGLAYTTGRIDGQRSSQRGSIYHVYYRCNKLTADRSSVDSGTPPSTADRSSVDSDTPPQRKVQGESTGEHLLFTQRSKDTVVSRSKYVDFSYIIHVAEAA
ncbi:hypothetical protein UY3_11180 [Chelonia mydas]|uniref:Uncharacterized protein n=1 Tax=Chelonia mydas TaxID=8469 RepID=M7BHW6_CHEMY|nr:hypothetical protein UY3_11180 [Chelonia mydas]